MLCCVGVLEAVWLGGLPQSNHSTQPHYRLALVLLHCYFHQNHPILTHSNRTTRSTHHASLVASPTHTSSHRCSCRDALNLTSPSVSTRHLTSRLRSTATCCCKPSDQSAHCTVLSVAMTQTGNSGGVSSRPYRKGTGRTLVTSSQSTLALGAPGRSQQQQHTATSAALISSTTYLSPCSQLILLPSKCYYRPLYCLYQTHWLDVRQQLPEGLVRLRQSGRRLRTSQSNSDTNNTTQQQQETTNTTATTATAGRRVR